ncbi:RpiR family transcriptional regulator [Marinobacterium nitratireducens]|uniref:RpiR family transcriptional regulator n=1 Tax=Marinobacterium nitratireducens TaxID=518897 RepID=A0A917ZQR6_9GAMM|nr:MurR/RpiR family transcriptional regulator [Marinobacterium nitratireducens]GGO87627.1 RpiR family transcriptional regulator [Marinobacterium nitratireducens]
MSHTAPESLESLRARLGGAEPPVRPGSHSHRVLTAMLQEPGFAAMASITELAQRFGVNASTLSRLAKRLGFDGFGAFQALFRNAVSGAGGHFYSDQASLLLEAGTGQPDLLHRIGREESSNIASMLDGVAPALFMQAAELLAGSRRVRIHGLRQYHALGYFMAYGLGMIRADVSTLDSGARGLADALGQLEAGDLLVVASSFPYTPAVITAAQAAKRRNLKVIALTDSSTSPLAPEADCCFAVPNRSSFYSNGMAGFFVLAESLLAETARLLGEQALESLRRREELIGELAPIT